MKMRLRRWRVARSANTLKMGYDSPPVRFWTRRGAVAAARQLNLVIKPMFAVNGYEAIRGRTLRSAMAWNIVKASGSYDRHPAGSDASKVATGWISLPVEPSWKAKPFHPEMTLAEYWLEGPGSVLLRQFDRPYTRLREGEGWMAPHVRKEKTSGFEEVTVADVPDSLGSGSLVLDEEVQRGAEVRAEAKRDGGS